MLEQDPKTLWDRMGQGICCGLGPRGTRCSVKWPDSAAALPPGHHPEGTRALDAKGRSLKISDQTLLESRKMASSMRISISIEILYCTLRSARHRYISCQVQHLCLSFVCFTMPVLAQCIFVPHAEVNGILFQDILHQECLARLPRSP